MAIQFRHLGGDLHRSAAVGASVDVRHPGCLCGRDRGRRGRCCCRRGRHRSGDVLSELFMRARDSRASEHLCIWIIPTLQASLKCAGPTLHVSLTYLIELYILIALYACIACNIVVRSAYVRIHMLQPFGVYSICSWRVLRIFIYAREYRLAPCNACRPIFSRMHT